MTQLPIADYALVSDCRSAGLVSKQGSMDWLCFPRFDGPAVFGRILDEEAGHWSIRPSESASVRRRYLPRSMVLETTFESDAGTLILTDAMAIGKNERGHELGDDSPGVVLRRVECTSGEVEVEMEFAPRPEYGLVHPLISAIDGGLVARGGADVLVLSSSEDAATEGSMARARFRLKKGETAAFALSHGFSWEGPADPWKSKDVAKRLEDTIEGWQTWSRLHQNYDGPWSDEVYLSGSVLQALRFAPTGAMVAAPTTSLPEVIGGGRNWDYRYAWIRDGSFTLKALWVAACPDEAIEFFQWMAGAVAAELRRGAEMQIMFGVGGERDLSERELGHLSGYRGSKPVRIGNGAWQQVQLDVYGELLDAAYRMQDYLDELDESARDLLVEMADTAAARWEEADNGIWEIRAEPQHFLYSKLMCWVAMDRAIAIADRLDAADQVDAWSKTRDRIRDAILERGWNDRVGAFTQAFGSDALDASVLMMPIVGFLPATDPRVWATIQAVQERLAGPRGLIYRYRMDDGLSGEEGMFLLCSFWLAQALALAGQVDRARELFERIVSNANDVGLLAEEIDPRTGELLGNFPQAISHIGLINAAYAISEAEREGQSRAKR